MAESAHETWKPVVGVPGYDVSNLGNIRSWRIRVSNGPGRVYSVIGDEPTPIKRTVTKEGYLVWGIREPFSGRTKQFKVHRTVLEAFVGPCPKGLIARHLDGNPQNCELSNLMWDTHLKNRQDRILHGRNNDGPNNHTAKLSWEQVLEVRASTEPIRLLADRFGVHISTIYKIRQGKTWKQ